MSGVLYGVGLGPGDPELMTRKAHRLISSAHVVAYPAPDTGESFARSIAANILPDDAIELPIVIPMRTARFPAQEVYDAAAQEISGHLEQGQDVVVLCEGDPFFYGSFMYLFARLADRFEVEVVPGVTSLTACAALSHRPLCARNEALAVVPGPEEAGALEKALSAGQATAILKVGRHLPRLRAEIAQAGLLDRAIYVSHASLPQQRVCALADAPETAPYFSMILIGGEDPYGTL
ncbi:MAG: precorrin-2 C(20)-methyltransferase [Pseudomonadota bacterium]